MRRFFGIETTYRFELTDLFALLTVLNVVLILVGSPIGMVIGLVSCAINFVVLVKTQGHINAYIIQIMLVVLNVYFLIS